MADRFEERLNKLSEDLNKLSQRAVEVCGDAKAAGELGQEVLQDKIKDAKGDMVAVQENIRLAGEEGKNHLSSQILKAQMTLEAMVEDLKDAHDKKKMEKYIDKHIIHLADLYDSINFLLSDVELTILETATALDEYKERFGEKEEEEA